MNLLEPDPSKYRVPFTMDDFNGMPYRRLGRSGLRASNIGLGTWKFGFPETGDGARTNAAAAMAILDRALELGVTFWDTANRYNEASGNSERIIGRWFKANPDQRRNVVLATKIGGGMDGRTPNHCRASRANILDAVSASLQRLQTDYVDLLYVHVFDGDTPPEETLSVMEDLVTRGLIRYFGVSNFTAENLELYRAAEEKTSCRCRAIAVQNKFDILHGEPDAYRGVLAYAARGMLSFIAYSPLARGLLTDRYLDTARAGPGDRLYDEKTLARDADAAMTKKVRALHALATDGGIRIEQLALACMLATPGMGPCIPAVSSIAQLESNAAAGKLALSDDLLQRVHAITTRNQK